MSFESECRLIGVVLPVMAVLSLLVFGRFVIDLVSNLIMNWDVLDSISLAYGSVLAFIFSIIVFVVCGAALFWYQDDLKRWMIWI